MLELASYGLTALVAILLVAFCFACKDDSGWFSGKHSSGSMGGPESSPLKGVEECRCAADTDSGASGQKHEGALHG